MDMNPAIIALQQGTQIAGQMEAAMQGGASATSVLGTALKSLFSPLTFIAIALTAIAAAGFQMVDWPGLAASALNALADVLQVIAPYAVAAAASLALLYAPAIIGGIVSVIALLGRMAVSAVTAAASIAAANPAGAFILGVTAAIAAANIFRDELAQIFGRDLVADAKSAVNFVIGAFVGAFNAIKATWSALPAAIGDLVYSAANATISGVEAMINKVAGLIDAFLAKLPFGVGEGAGVGTISLPRVGNPYAGAASSAAGAARGAFADAQGTDYVGAVTGAIERGASAATAKLQELAGSLAGAGAAAEGAGEKAKGAADKASDAWAGLRGVTDDVVQKMQESANTLGQSFGGIFRGLIDKTMSWKDAALSAINSVLKYLNDMNVVGGGKGIFGGGLFQSLIGGLLGIGFAKGGYTGNGAANAAAGVVHGREYVFNARATARIGKGNLDALHGAANGYRNGGYVAPVARAMPASNSNQPQPVPVHVTVGWSRTADGNLRPFIEDVSQRQAVGVVQAATPGIVKGSVTAVQQTSRNKPGFFR